MTTPQAGTVTATHVVKMVSGQELTLLNNTEVRWFDDTRSAYMSDLKFTEKTDLIDLDRLLVHELMIFRWTQYLAAGEDYAGDMIDEKRLSSDIKLFSDQVNKIKESMGLNKKSRDDAANEGSFATWLVDLKSRAKMFGVHRENQLTKALVLMNELSAIVGAYDRSDPEERAKLGFESEKEIVDWVRHTMLPEYRELDAHFRQNSQRYWVRDM